MIKDQSLSESWLTEDLRRYRRDLHQIPELGLQEFKTKEYILSVLQQYPCEITETGPTGMCAFFRASSPKYPGTVAFRCDMDGLPINETSETEYKSRNTGIMHACGHDGHMAMLLGLAGQLSEMQQTLPCNVLLIFQPAEESPGGAQAMVGSGILDRFAVKRIFSMHISPSPKPHTIYSRPLEFMAKSSELNIRILGRSAHLAAASKGIDALHIGCLFLDELYTMEKNSLPEDEFRLLKFGRMESGSVRNAVSDNTILEGTLRCFSTGTFDFLIERIRQTASEYEAKYGCTIKVDHSEGYPPSLNDPELFELAKEALSDFEFITLRKPSVSSDDFSFFLQKVPGVYFFLGTGEKTPLHSDVFDFNEDILLTGVRAYLKLLRIPL